MANAELSYTVYPKKRKYRSGKEIIVWYYSLNPACGLPEEVNTGNLTGNVPLIPRMIGLLEDLRSDGLRVSDDDWIFGYDSRKPLLYNWFRDA